MNTAAQIFGIIAMIFSVFSFQMNKHKQIMLMQIGALAFFILQFFLLGAYTGVAINLVAIVRAIVFYNRDKKWASGNIWIVVFVIMFIIAGALTWTGPVSFFITASTVLNTFSFSFTKPVLVRSTILISSPFLLVYSILIGSIGGVINEICVEISSIVGLFRYDIKKKKMKFSKKMY